MAAKTKKWSQDVTDSSDTMDLKNGIFKERSPMKKAASLKRSAEHSHRRKATSFQSAMPMLTFYINRAGGQLPKSRKAVLEKAKAELRKSFFKE